MKKIVSKTIKPTLLGITIFILCSNNVNAQSRIYVNEYLNIGIGARGLAMGGAQVTSTKDAYSAYWNPAGLANMENYAELGLMHAEYFASMFQYDYGSFALKLKDKKRVIGFSALRFGTDNIPYTIDYVQPDGSFDDSKLKSISAGDYAFNISYAQKLGWFKNSAKSSATFGANAKLIYRHVGKMSNAWGAGLDLGLQIKANKWRFGISAKDITTTRTAWSFNFTEKEKEIFYKTDNEIPIKSFEVMTPKFNVGIGRYFFSDSSKFQFFAELGGDITTDGKRIATYSSNTVSLDARFGLEASYKNTIFLRAGLSNAYQALDNSDSTNTKKYWVYQPAVGVGFKINQLHIDYAFTSLNMQDKPLYSHVVSLKLDFNKRNKKTIQNENTPTNAIPPAHSTNTPKS